MSWQTEFPRYPHEAMPALPPDFEDVSWHNDVCPSIASDTLRLWIFIGYPDEQDREIPGPRFSMIEQDSGVEVGTWILETDHWSDVLAEIERRRQHGTPVR